MRMFKGLKEATVGAKGRYLGRGSYDLLVKECKITGRFENFFCAELVILACDDAIDDTGTAFRAGDEATYMVNFKSKYPELALGDLKAFMIGLDPDLDLDQIESDAEELVGPSNPARGVVVHAVAIQKPQKEDPTKSFTHVRWSPASADAYDTYNEMIKAALA